MKKANPDKPCPLCKCIGVHAYNCQFPKQITADKLAEREARKKAHNDKLRAKTSKNRYATSLKDLKEKQEQTGEANE